MSEIDLIASDAVLALARELALPDAVCERLAESAGWSLREDGAAQCMALTDPDDAPHAWALLHDALAVKDADGMGMLALYLAAACHTRARYRELGMPDEVFFDTMGCFSRFLEETRQSTGHFVFDRGFWAWRQLSCRLFRLGTLEFEYRTVAPHEPLPPGLAPGDAILSVHIPSDACLSDAALRDSYNMAQCFFAGPGAAVCAQGMPHTVLCRTWLLAPALKTLLPAGSGILRFGADYVLYIEEPENEDFYRWLFGGKKPLEQLPRETSLQRAVAAHLAQGGKIGAAGGVFVGDMSML
ncbi:MAG: DUF5596 domain-containing protein [Subdoligranulum sp.]|nr:DUF5596 domain-containing protein [Subdoligranulum sp.]